MSEELFFPTLSIQPDASTLKIAIPNPAKEPESTDGGYMFTRPKFTRRPAKTFSFKFQDLGQADRDILEQFWDRVKGSSVAFNWRDPTNNKLHNVRFGKGMSLEFMRTGVGMNSRYETNEIQLTEV